MLSTKEKHVSHAKGCDTRPYRRTEKARAGVGYRITLHAARKRVGFANGIAA